MSDFIRIVTHSRRLKSAVKELSIEQLEEIKTKLQTIIEERIAEETAEQQENAERLEKIRKYKEMLAADGIDLEELSEFFPERQGKRAPRQPKYEVWNEAGERITWTEYLQSENRGWRIPRYFPDRSITSSTMI